MIKSSNREEDSISVTHVMVKQHYLLTSKYNVRLLTHVIIEIQYSKKKKVSTIIIMKAITIDFLV